MANILDLLRYAGRFVVFFVTNCYGLFGYVMWTVMLLPLRALWPGLYWKIESTLFKALQSFVILWINSGGYGVMESGDDINKLSEQDVVLMANHQSTADTPLLMMALWNKGKCMANSYWIMDWIFRFTNFGLISTIRRDVFIKQGKETRDSQMVMLKEHLQQCYLPQGRKWIILFPEGGFLRKRIESSQNYARKNNFPVLQKVSLPRIGALKIILDTIGAPDNDNANGTDNLASETCEVDPERPLRWIVDMTIAYLNKEGAPPDMFGMCLGYREKQDMYVHYRAYPLTKVPRDDEALLKWLYDRYEEKEHLLDYFERHGQFPADNMGGVLPTKSPQLIVYDWINVLLIQGFYLASAYLHYTCVLQPLWSLVFG